VEFRHLKKWEGNLQTRTSLGQGFCFGRPAGERMDALGLETLCGETAPAEEERGGPNHSHFREKREKWRTIEGGLRWEGKDDRRAI